MMTVTGQMTKRQMIGNMFSIFFVIFLKKDYCLLDGDGEMAAFLDLLNSSASLF